MNNTEAKREYETVIKRGMLRAGRAGELYDEAISRADAGEKQAQPHRPDAGGK